MEAWVLVLYTNYGHIQMDIQSEDACITVAKVLTERAHHPAGVCVNQFDGRVLWFRHGKQVD